LTKFKILLHRRAESFLGKLDAHKRNRIADKLRELEDFPATKLDIIKIAGEEDTFRLRIGKYRALFKIYHKENIIVVVDIDLRKRVYRP
jgi:mRNA interferase RelE/StbE